MIRRKNGRLIVGWRVVVAPAALPARPQRDDERHNRRQVALQAPRRADADERPHQEAQIEAADMDE